MLQVFVYKNNRREALELYPDTLITLNSMSPLFDVKLDQGTQSLPFEFPWSERNRKILDSPEMIEGLTRDGLPWYQIDVLDNNLPEITEGKLTILQSKGSFGYRDGTYVGSITGGESRFGSIIKGKTLKDLHLGGLVSWGGTTTSRDFAEIAMKYTPGLYPFAFAPIRNTEFIDTNRSDYTTEFLSQDTVNNIIYNPAAFTNGWYFAVPQPSTPNQPIPPGTAGYNDYRTIPFYNLHYVFKKVFEEHGYLVSGEWLDDADYAQLYIYNNWSLELASPTNNDLNRFIHPPNHVPKIDLGNFLLQVQNYFGFGIFLEGNGQIRIRYRTSAINPARVVNITNYCEDYFEDELTEVATGGVKIEWDFSGNDSASSDWVKEINSELVRAEVSKFSDIAALTFTPPLKTGDLVLVHSENFYYSYDAGNLTWNYFAEGHTPVVVGEGGQAVKPEVAPLIQAVTTDGAGGNTNYDMCACNGVASYNNYSGVRVESEYPFRIFYIKNVDKNLATGVPTSFSHNSDSIGVKRVATSLALNAADGIYKRHHKVFYNSLRNGKYYRVNILKTWMHRLKLDYSTGVQIKNVQYVIVDIEKDLGEDQSYVKLKLLPI